MVSQTSNWTRCSSNRKNEVMTDNLGSFAGIQSIIDAIPNVIFAKDRSHKIVLVNASACAFFGYSRETLLNRPDTELFPAEQIRSFHAADDLVFETGKESENEEQVTDGSGRIRQVLTRKRLAYLDGTQYLVASLTDVTAFREAEARNRYMAFCWAIVESCFGGKREPSFVFLA